MLHIARSCLSSLASLLLVSIFLVATIAPQASALAIGSAEARPNLIRDNDAAAAASKRIVLWDYTLTRDVGSVPGIKKSAASLAKSKVTHTVINWETWRPSELPANLIHEPTVRTPTYLSGDNWNNVKSAATARKGLTVHFYNEPERQSPTVTAEQAAAQWKSHMVPLRKKFGAKLGSPACAADATGTAWMDAFMSHLGAGEKPDFVGLHYYTAQDGNAKQQVAAAQSYLQGRHGKFGIPVSVREIASTSRTQGVVTDFTKQMSAWLDKQSWVHSYGFFGVSRMPVDSFVSPKAQLMGPQGDWTDLGRFFFAL
ncbi:glycoside hydrolase family 128 protein [Xylariaceae sp. FL1651]|nr:glycoside hydrolase family 128 protein [Xylariaceae sp. FL1651]